MLVVCETARQLIVKIYVKVKTGFPHCRRFNNFELEMISNIISNSRKVTEILTPCMSFACLVAKSYVLMFLCLKKTTIARGH